MVFNDTVNEQGLVQEIDAICNSDSNSYPIKSKTRRLNNALDRFFAIAMKTDGRWEMDDSTYTDYPIASATLTADKTDYTFPSELLDIFRVEVQDEGGLWREIKPLDQSDLKGVALDEFMKTSAQPVFYDKKYSALWLYPAPNYDKANGLKIHYNRKLSHFAATDTTKKAGLPEIFSPYLARHASLPFLIEKSKANKNDIKQLIVEDEDDIKKYYSRRSRDEKTRALPRRGRPNFI